MRSLKYMNKKQLFNQLAAFVAIVAVLLVIGQVRQGKVNFNREAEAGLTSQAEYVADKVEVFYFHGTLRCPSCVALERYSRETVEEYFADELAEGKIVFREINVELPENKEVAEKFAARGSSLFTNAIYDDKDHIEEEVSIWRFIGDEVRFKENLKNKIDSHFGRK